MDTDELPTESMRVIDLLKALVDLPADLLRDACRMNPDARLASEGCDCYGDVVWVQVNADGSVTLCRKVPASPMPQPSRNWFTRDGRKVAAGHQDAFVEVNDEWTHYFSTGTWPPAEQVGG